MFRKRTGSLGFSFTRFADNTFPNLIPAARVNPPGTLSHYHQDVCYAHQIASANAYALDERSFFVAGIADSESLSRRVHKTLTKHGVLREDGTVNTYAIGPKFTHQMAILNVNRQKDLVGMLFWWEEECQRLRKLVGEEQELNELIDAAEKRLAEADEGLNVDGDKETLDQLRLARERVRMKRRQRPSQRQADVEADNDDIMMVYHGRAQSVPENGLRHYHTAPGASAQQERPPEYFAGS